MPDFAYDELRKKPALTSSVLNNSPRHRYLVAHAPTILAALLTSDDTRWHLTTPGVQKVYEKKVRYAVFLTNWLYEVIIHTRDIEIDIEEPVIGKRPVGDDTTFPVEESFDFDSVQD